MPLWVRDIFCVTIEYKNRGRLYHNQQRFPRYFFLYKKKKSHLKLDKHIHVYTEEQGIERTGYQQIHFLILNVFSNKK